MEFPLLDELRVLLNSVTPEEIAKAGSRDDPVEEGDKVIGVVPKEIQVYHTLADRLENEFEHVKVDLQMTAVDSPEESAAHNKAYQTKRLRNLLVDLQWVGICRAFNCDRVQIAKDWAVIDRRDEVSSTLL